MKVYSVFSIIVFSFTTNIFSQVQFNPHTITTNANFANSVFEIDVDRDNDIDVLSADLHKIAWYENDGNENFTTHNISTNAPHPGSVFAIDLDDDEDVDVLSASFDLLLSEITRYENDGNENFTTHVITGGPPGANSVYAIDLDSDGDVDVLATFTFDNYYNYVDWYENDGNENFTTHTITTNLLYPYSVFAIDVDRDNDIDVLSAGDNKIAWYESDGDMDVLSSGVDIIWYENNGHQNFTLHTIPSVGAWSIYAVDVDNDNDIDVLSASWLDDKIAWYENDGNEIFTPHTITTSADGAYSVYAVDVDGDRDMDVLSASGNDDKIAWYENLLIVGVDDNNLLGVPVRFQLYNNYPNPFNPTTTIKYQIPEISFVTIKVYDVLGNEIATLVNEEKPIGSYEVEFNASNLTSGIYFKNYFFAVFFFAYFLLNFSTLPAVSRSFCFPVKNG